MSQIKDDFLPMLDKYDKELQDLLADVYLLMNFYLSGEGNLELNRFIGRKVQVLKNKYRLSKNDILHYIYTDFITKKLYDKYDPCKSKRTTFTAHCTNYLLQNLLKKHNAMKEKPHFSTVSFDELYEQKKENDDHLGSNIHCWKENGLPSLSNKITPEDEYIGMELQGMVDDHFGELYGQVISGYLTKHDAADKHNVKYNTFCKSFRRKLDGFIPVLSGTGYLC